MAIDYKEIGGHLQKRLVEEELETYSKVTEDWREKVSSDIEFMVNVSASALNEYGSALFNPPRADDINKKIIEVGMKEGTIRKEGEKYRYNYPDGRCYSVDTYGGGLTAPCMMATFLAHEAFEVAKERNPQAKGLMNEVENHRQKAGREGNGGFSQALSELQDLEGLEKSGRISFKEKDNSQVAMAAMMQAKSNVR
ncbi:MAG: hypothetical protein J6J35_04745 [Alphaproteobacteria bacterium]|nr:hypothetical protein [Alphaproteobacteria bacterium]